MPGVHTEINLESEIVAYLTDEGRGWAEGDPEKYDKGLALYPEDVIAWIQESQPEHYAKAKATHNGASDSALLERLKKSIDDNGTLHVLRKGFKYVGLKTDVRMCAFKPDSTRNAEEMALYGKARLRVIRQVRYSKNNGNSIDLVLFINGIPVATLELKTDFTQDVQSAITQYKTERLPKDAGTKLSEPLLMPKRGAIVHFAVSDEEIYMTTALAGSDTYFLPFNMGNDQGAGNPINPSGGAKTSYLWERVLQRDAWLDIMGRFVHIERKQITRDDGRKENRETTIFPRFHQWDVVTKLTAASLEAGPGTNYLIEHSAGSGKSNSIMWAAHRLSTLHDASEKKVFDLVLVLTDRNVLDIQLRDTISGYGHAPGHVKIITNKLDSKSANLADALVNAKGIVIVTLQTFPHVLKALESKDDAAGLHQKTYAIIADEAHSSQTGEDAKEIRELLGLSDDEPDAIITTEDVLAARMAKRGSPKNMSYFAFTATPKQKTIDLFGTLAPDGRKRPFHIYTMQQAIEEGFILDVLQNYTTFKFAYKLASTEAMIGEKIVPKSETAKIIERGMRLHASNVAQQVAIIVEHFRENVQHLLGGKAKAMVVCDSRKAAVTFKIAIDEYLQKQEIAGVATLVAFSGEVVDDGTWPGHTFTEPKMNGISSGAIVEEFGGGGYQVLIVAEKFQTGFDQPLLSAMYVNKKLANIAAVQTLSRLNRTYKNGSMEKTVTFILDFVNDAADILAAFQPYYRDAYLTDTTDPNLILDLQTKLDESGIYTQEQIDAYVSTYIAAVRSAHGVPSHTRLKGALDPIVQNYNHWILKSKADKNDEESERAEIFRRNMVNFVHAYNFLSQIHNYADTEVEKRALFYSGLTRLLHRDRDNEIIDTSGVVATHLSNRITFAGSIGLGEGDHGALKPITSIGTAQPRQKEYGPLAEIIKLLNELFGSGIKEEDAIALSLPFDEIMNANTTIRDQALNNDVEQFTTVGEFPDTLDSALLNAQEIVVDENSRQADAVKSMVNRLFEDKEIHDRFVKAYGAYYHRTVNTAPPIDEQNDTTGEGSAN